EILLYAYDANPVLWALGLVTALLTAFYMSRQVFMVFFGEERWHGDHVLEPAAGGESDADADGSEPAEQAESAEAAVEVETVHAGTHADPHESPWTMW